MMRRAFCVLVLLLPLAAAAADRRVPDDAAIASAHPLATEAGIEILGQGGNAFDAAVAVSAALAVVEPYSSGIGGGGFWLLQRADGFEVFVDGREVAPAAATADMYLDEHGAPVPKRSLEGPLAAGIPGQPAALAHIAAKFGRLTLAQNLVPAMRLAEDGFPVYERLQAGLRAKRSLLRRWPGAQGVFLPGGDLPAVGAVLRQPELAETLRALVENGHEGFYAGPVAERLIAGVRANGGIWTAADLEAYRVRERAPLRAEYRGVRITTAPPPSAGGVALIEILNVLSGFDLGALDGAARKHLVVEAMRRAYRDRAEFLGDPDFVEVPVERLTHPYYAAGLRAAIRTDRAMPSAFLPGIQPTETGTQTTHLSVLDGEGNRVAATLSINFWFGSGFMPEGTGVLLNNEMNDFSVKPGVPDGYQLVGADANAIAPGKRMVSSMTPTILESSEGLAILGTPGGSRIISMVLLGALAWMDGADAAEMAALPRYHHQYLPDRLSHEADALSAEERSALESMGHELAATEDSYGNMHVVTWDFASGEVAAASDPRGVGAGYVY
jgi:gamma-glutamyltranspeptidase/glutathione hydrolase